jgi:hypothetical protein
LARSSALTAGVPSAGLVGSMALATIALHLLVGFPL